VLSFGPLLVKPRAVSGADVTFEMAHDHFGVPEALALVVERPS
jgi:hypothetical protein